jgi:hypothetical protein
MLFPQNWCLSHHVLLSSDFLLQEHGRRLGLTLRGWGTVTTTWPSRSGARRLPPGPHAQGLDDYYSTFALGGWATTTRWSRRQHRTLFFWVRQHHTLPVATTGRLLAALHPRADSTHRRSGVQRLARRRVRHPLPDTRARGGEGWAPAAGTRAHERRGHPELHSSLDGKGGHGFSPDGKATSRRVQPNGLGN